MHAARIASIAPGFGEPRALVGGKAEQRVVGRLLHRLLHRGASRREAPRAARRSRRGRASGCRGEPHDLGADAAQLGQPLVELRRERLQRSRRSVDRRLRQPIVEAAKLEAREALAVEARRDAACSASVASMPIRKPFSTSEATSATAGQRRRRNADAALIGTSRRASRPSSGSTQRHLDRICRRLRQHQVERAAEHAGDDAPPPPRAARGCRRANPPGAPRARRARAARARRSGRSPHRARSRSAASARSSVALRLPGAAELRIGEQRLPRFRRRRRGQRERSEP